MDTTVEEIMTKGMQCLIEHLGIVDAERFIFIIIREKFDYTKWQCHYFDTMQPGEFQSDALEYAKKNPYTGNAEQL